MGVEVAGSNQSHSVHVSGDDLRLHRRSIWPEPHTLGLVLSLHEATTWWMDGDQMVYYWERGFP